MSVTDALRSGGNIIPEICVAAARIERVDVALIATICQNESYGGRNVWGSDGVQTGGTYVKGGTVTRANYLAYREAMRAKRIGRQGVGPAQCTSAEFQDRADANGGCWDPLANLRSGARGMQDRITRYGSVTMGATRYNGSGPAADAYGRRFSERFRLWQQRLSGLLVPAGAGGGQSGGPNTMPELVHGMRNDDRVRALQAGLNRYAWRPALPLLPVTGNYLDQTAQVLAAAQVQMGIRGGDGRNTGPQTRRGLWERSIRW